MVQYFICKSCKKLFTDRTLIIPLELNPLCNKCQMERRTDLDRTGRSSKKDRFKSKEVKVSMY